VFDIKIPTKKGMLHAMRVKQDQEYCCIISTENTVRMSADEAHCKLGHMSFQATKDVANTLNWKFTGAPDVKHVQRARQNKRMLLQGQDQATMEMAEYLLISVLSIILNILKWKMYQSPTGG
jgi:hypothetical protein